MNGNVGSAYGNKNFPSNRNEYDFKITMVNIKKGTKIYMASSMRNIDL